MDVATGIIGGFLNIVATLAALVVCGLVSVFLVRLSISALPSLARFAVLFGRVTGQIVSIAVAFLTSHIQLVVNTFIMGVTAWLTLVGMSAMFDAYGGDFPALIPTILLAVVSVGSGVTGRSFGALLAGGFIVAATGLVALNGDYLFRSLLIVGALGVAVSQNQFQRGGNYHATTGQEK